LPGTLADAFAAPLDTVAAERNRQAGIRQERIEKSAQRLERLHNMKARNCMRRSTNAWLCISFYLVAALPVSFSGCAGKHAPMAAGDGAFDLGSRELPTRSVAIHQLSPAQEGQPFAVQMALGGENAPLSVEVWAGITGLHSEGTMALPVEGNGLTYQATMACNGPVDGARVWVRIVENDGSIVESGCSDFALAVE
jgi:hypothetical protein